MLENSQKMSSNYVKSGREGSVGSHSKWHSDEESQVGKNEDRDIAELTSRRFLSLHWGSDSHVVGNCHDRYEIVSKMCTKDHKTQSRETGW